MDEECFSVSTDEYTSDEDFNSDDGEEYCPQTASVCASYRQFRCRRCDRLAAENSDDAENEDQPTNMLGWSTDDIRTAQHEDCEIRFVTDLLPRHSERHSLDTVADQSAEVKALFNEWDRLATEEGILFRRWTSIVSAANRRQVVLPQKYSTFHSTRTFRRYRRSSWQVEDPGTGRTACLLAKLERRCVTGVKVMC